MTVPIKQQRAQARILIQDDPYIINMIECITNTGQVNGVETLGKVRYMAQQAGIPNPTLKQWEHASNLSEVFKIVERKRYSKGRPMQDLTGFIVGALMVDRGTGYVNWRHDSPVWICTCDYCARQVVMTTHKLMYGLPYCGRGKSMCPKGYAFAKQHRRNKNGIYYSNPLPNEAETRRLINNMKGTTNQEIH